VSVVFWKLVDSVTALELIAYCSYDYSYDSGMYEATMGGACSSDGEEEECMQNFLEESS
jgi:hypothetical protein